MGMAGCMLFPGIEGCGKRCAAGTASSWTAASRGTGAGGVAALPLLCALRVAPRLARPVLACVLSLTAPAAGIESTLGSCGRPPWLRASSAWWTSAESGGAVANAGGQREASPDLADKRLGAAELTAVVHGTEHPGNCRDALDSEQQPVAISGGPRAITDE